MRTRASGRARVALFSDFLSGRRLLRIGRVHVLLPAVLRHRSEIMPAISVCQPQEILLPILGSARVDVSGGSYIFNAN